jgi:transposase InsO family protein
VYLITNQGKEFCARAMKQLFIHLGIKHIHTTARQLQNNSQAKVANKTISKFLTSYMKDTTLDWEQYLPSLMFNYNTSIHESVQNIHPFSSLSR